MFVPLLAAWTGTLIGLAAVAMVIALVIVSARQLMALTAALKQAMGTLPGLTPTQQFIASDAQTAFAVDENARKICLATAGEPPIVSVVPYGEVLEVDLLEDGVVLSRAARASRLRGVMLSGTDVRPIDVPRSGLTVTTPPQPVAPGKVRSLQLRLNVNDVQTPLHVVNFLNLETARTDSNYMRMMNEARGWFNWFAQVIEQAEQQAPNATTAAATAGGTASLADELAKLAQLRDAGTIDETEFAAAKARLITRS
jgi:hypothetical protein